MSESKTCTKCGESKPLDLFARAKQAPGGIRSFCKACAAAKLREWTKANPDKVRRASAKYRAANFDQRAAGYRSRYERERDQILEYQRAYRAANREQRAANLRAWAERNPEKVVEYQRRRRAAKRGSTVGPVDLDALWTGACALCGLELDATIAHPDPLSKSVDHIVPLSRGGGHVQDNLQWAHLICNMRKGARVPDGEVA